MGWDDKRIKKLYEKERTKISDMYPSEEYFIKKFLKDDMDVLDVGCACGGWKNILDDLNLNINYTGVDVSNKMLSVAKKRHPNSDFVNCRNSLLFGSDAFDFVFSFGVLHEEVKYKHLIMEMILVSKQFVLFDVRLNFGCEIISKQNVNGVVLPYMIFDFADFFEFVLSLGFEFQILSYYIDSNAIGVDRCLMVMFLIDKTYKSKQKE